MKRALSSQSTSDERWLEGGIERIAARQIAPLQNELTRLCAYVEALRAEREPW
jgi:hypothetical protein